MKNKKSSLESEPIIIWIIVILVILLAVFFLFRTRIDLWIKNLPEYQRNDGEDIEILPYEVQTAICPDGYEEVGRFGNGGKESFFYIMEGSVYKKTLIKSDFGKNILFIDPEGFFNKINLGVIITSESYEKKINVYENIFIKDSPGFKRVLKQQALTGEKLFRYLIILNNSLIKGLNGPNYVCQKKEVIENINKTLVLIYGMK